VPLLDSAALRVGSVSRIHSATPEAIVISQGAAPGATVGEASTVDLLISAGPADRLTFLPDLQGLPLEEARYLAGLAGLRDDQIQVEPVTVTGTEAGTVVLQSLLPWREFRQREAMLRLGVTAPAAAGEAAEKLPSLTGLTLEEAREAAAGFQIRVQEVGTLELPEGVIRQDPAAGSDARTGVLTLTVNLHPKRIPRPLPTLRVHSPQPRSLGYDWYIEPGIGSQVARVYAITLEGERDLVASYQVQGGDLVQGEWETSHPGVIYFELLLNGEPYGGRQLAR
jgi:hypothetical protein